MSLAPATKEPMAEVLGLQGDVTVDTTATGEFSILRSQQQEAATATDAEAEEMRAERAGPGMAR